MRGFFKIFFASLLALAIFTLLLFFVLIGMASSLTKKGEEKIAAKSVLTLDLSRPFTEHTDPDPVAALRDGTNPTLYEVIRLLAHAKENDNVGGIYLPLDGNANGYASSNELRLALQDFKRSGNSSSLTGIS
jgi:protease-4